MIMIEDKLKDEISGAVQAVFNERINLSKITIERPQNKEHGDFSTNISFQLAKNINNNPAKIAGKISDYLNGLLVFEKCEAVGGFVNIFLNKKYFYEVLNEILTKKAKFGRGKKKSEKVQVEYISANPTGPMHLGHARNGYIGDVLANCYKYLGYDTTKEYYVNDAGNQVITLGHSVIAAAGLEKIKEDYYKGEYIDAWVASNKKYIKENKENPEKIGKKVAAYVLNSYTKKTVKAMKIDFDVWFSEEGLYMRKEVDKMLDFMKKNDLTYEKDRALWFRTSKFGDDEDRVLIKSDGTMTYITPDIAYHYDKFVIRKFDKVINVLGTDHHGYVPRLQAAVTAMGYAGKLDVILLQLVRLVKDGKEYKMSKRKGLFVTIDDLFSLIGGKDASDVARFLFLSSSYDTQMAFDLNLAKENSEKNPVFYVKYAYARICGIIAKAKGITGKGKADLTLLTEPAELDLIDQLSQLPYVVQSIELMKDYPVHNLTFYARDVAAKFHSFYDKCRVIDDANPELSAARLKLVEATKIVLSIVSIDLIGIDLPEKM